MDLPELPEDPEEDIPEDDIPEDDIPEDDVPLPSVPKTGDISCLLRHGRPVRLQTGRAEPAEEARG